MSKLISKSIIYNSIIKAKCGKKISKGEDGYQTSADILNQKFNDMQNGAMRNIYIAGLFRRPSSTSTEKTSEASKSQSTTETPTTAQTPVAQTPASQTEPAPFTMKAPQYNKPKISFWDRLFGRTRLKEQNARLQFDQANQNYLNAYRKWGDDLTNYYTNKARTMSADIMKYSENISDRWKKENEALNSDWAKTFWGQRAMKAGLLSDQEVRDWQAKHNGLAVDGKFGRESMKAWNAEHKDQPSLQFTEEDMKAATFVPRTTYPGSSNRGTRNKGGGDKPVKPVDNTPENSDEWTSYHTSTGFNFVNKGKVKAGQTYTSKDGSGRTTVKMHDDGKTATITRTVPGRKYSLKALENAISIDGIPNKNWLYLDDKAIYKDKNTGRYYFSDGTEIKNPKRIYKRPSYKIGNMTNQQLAKQAKYPYYEENGRIYDTNTNKDVTSTIRK